MSLEEQIPVELKPLPYHQGLRDYLKKNEPDSWQWFSSAESLADYTESLRLDLLKHTYRLDADTHPGVYEIAVAAKQGLNLDIPLTLYQSQHGQQFNAALFYIPGEGHIVFEGQLLSLMNPAELKSVLAHELSHYKLWQQEGGEFLVTQRMIHAMANDPRSQPSHIQSARWYNLYTEIYADRGALFVTSDRNSVVSSLIKIQTGLSSVSAESYLRQADEIFSKTKVKAEELTHPEAYIRARAIDVWSRATDETELQIKRTIEGSPIMNELDLLGQERLSQITKKLLASFLRSSWLQTDLLLGHARFFFDDFLPDPDLELNADDLRDMEDCDSHLQQYFAYILLDFATADPELEKVPLSAALLLADKIKIGKTFEEILNRELKMSKKEIEKLKISAEELVKTTEQQAGNDGQQQPDVS